jgi:hypothetical protein
MSRSVRTRHSAGSGPLSQRLPALGRALIRVSEAEQTMKESVLVAKPPRTGPRACVTRLFLVGISACLLASCSSTHRGSGPPTSAGRLVPTPLITTPIAGSSSSPVPAPSRSAP